MLNFALSKMKQGEAYEKDINFEIKQFDMRQTVFNCPSSVNFVDSFPPGGSLRQRHKF